MQDYGFRLYAPAIGKFLSVDPLRGDYPELTCYQFASNTPIWAIDLDGLEARQAIMNAIKEGIKIPSVREVFPKPSMHLNVLFLLTKAEENPGKPLYQDNLFPKENKLPYLTSTDFSLSALFDVMSTGLISTDLIVVAGGHGSPNSLQILGTEIEKKELNDMFLKLPEGILAGSGIIFLNCAAAQNNEGLSDVAKHTGATIFAAYTETTGGLARDDGKPSPLSLTDEITLDKLEAPFTKEITKKLDFQSQEFKQLYLDNIGYVNSYLPNGKVYKAPAPSINKNGRLEFPNRSERITNPRLKQAVDGYYKRYNLPNPDEK